MGMAWVAADDGSVITAAHLFEGPQARIELLFADNQRVTARLLAVDRGHDLALLAMNAPAPRIRPLRLARRPPSVGAEVFQFGAPFFRSGMLQHGVVAAEHIRFEFQDSITDYAETVPVAAMMQGGTSGGPWLNRRGEVVGMQSSTVSLDGKPVGVAFMAPAAAVRRLLTIRTNAATPTPGLGVDELWQQPAEYLTGVPSGAEGLVVAVVRAGGPAGRAGIRPGDLLLEANQQPLFRIADLPRLVRRHRPGEAIEFRVRRPNVGEELNFRVVLERAEDVWPSVPPGN